MSYIGVPPFGQTVRTLTELTASAAQAVFNISGGYLPGYIDVFLNGSSLASSDFTATNGTTVTLLSAAAVGDEFKAIAYWPVSLVDTYRKSEAVAKSGDTMTGTLNVPRISIEGAPNVETVENNGRFSSRHISYPAFLFKDMAGTTKAEAYFGVGGGDLTLINYATNGMIRLVANGVESLKGDHAGRVTLPNQPAFYAHTFTTGSYGNGALIPFSATRFNRSNCFNSSLSRFTAPVSGIYAFQVGLYVYNGTGASLQSYAFKVNGSEIAPSGDTFIFYSAPSQAATDNMTTGSVLIELSAGDYVTLNMRSGSTTVSVYSGHSFFCGHLIG